MGLPCRVIVEARQDSFEIAYGQTRPLERRRESLCSGRKPLGCKGFGHGYTSDARPPSMTRLPPEIEAHFRAPQHAKPPAEGSSVGRAENLACGDHLELALRAQGGLLADVRWRGRGCSALIGLASLVCEELEGLALAQAARYDVEARVERAGGLPPARRHAAQVVARALGLALADCRKTCQS
jgi:nitrogen fixation NifU-like protein